MEITLKNGTKYTTSYIKFEGFMLVFIPQGSGTVKEQKLYIRDLESIINHEEAN